MEQKKCCMCKELLEIKCFKSNKRHKDGLQSQCVECQKEYRRKHYQLNKQKYIDKAKFWSDKFSVWWREYKEQFVCDRCGESDSVCIDFHHINDDKDMGVAQLVAHGNKKRILKELDKCIPLCANCHRKEHRIEYK